MRHEVWIGTIEISYKDEASGSFTPAFTVVTTWAATPEEFREKCERMLQTYGWNLLGVESDVRPAPVDGVFSEEVTDMLERTRTNPNAIIYGTFFTYPVM